MPRDGRSFSRLCIPAVAALVAALLMASRPSAVLAQAAPAAANRTTRDGVYTDAQAERGQMVFEVRCNDCHTARMWGADWNGKPVADVFEFISQYMPEDGPGTLQPDQVRDVIAFLLKSNSLPSGPAELPTTVDALKQITLQKPE
jgi:mono/diheme cytochrome c family protein